MKIEVEFWQLVGFLLSFFGFVAGVGKLIYDQLLKKDAAISEDMGELEKRSEQTKSDHAQRIAKLEVAIERMPSHNDLAKLYEQVNAQGRQLSRIDGQLEQINANVRLVLNRLDKEKTP